MLGSRTNNLPVHPPVPRFTREENVKSHSKVKSSEQRGIRGAICDQVFFSHSLTHSPIFPICHTPFFLYITDSFFAQDAHRLPTHLPSVQLVASTPRGLRLR